MELIGIIIMVNEHVMLIVITLQHSGKEIS